MRAYILRNTRRLAKFRTEALEHIQSLDKSVQQLKVQPDTNASNVSVAGLFLSHHKSCRLNLDDAVIVLRNLTQTSTMDSRHYSMKDIQSLVDRKANSLIASQNLPGQSTVFPRLTDNVRRDPLNSQREFQARSPSNKRNTFRGRQKRTISFEQPTSAVCYNCRERGHYRGSQECKEPSTYTKKKRSRVDQGQTKPTDYQGPNTPFFREGSGGKNSN